MNPQSKLTRKDYEDYLVSLYFGTDQDLMTACIKRAYLDFNRTMHGLLFANKNIMINSRIKLSGYEQKDNTDNERD